GTLFRLDYDLLLYDLTSTYFEGLAEENDLAQRGYSRDHRSDCKQVVWALCGDPRRFSPGASHAGGKHPGPADGRDYSDRG
ncbi:MAG TPA: transposase, partial [Candidatus Methylomirabilis sp.]|nr:transposase [Candidatus Methylomirabilis sp.]